MTLLKENRMTVNHNDQPYQQMVGTPQIKVNPKEPAEGNAKIIEQLKRQTTDDAEKLTPSQKEQLADLLVLIKIDLDRIGDTLWRRKMRHIFDEDYASQYSKDTIAFLAKMILNFNDVTSLIRGYKEGAFKRVLRRAKDLIEDLHELSDLELPEGVYTLHGSRLEMQWLDARSAEKKRHAVEAEVRKGDRVPEPSKERCYDLIHDILEGILKRNLGGETPRECLKYMEQIFNAVCSKDDAGMQEEIGVSEAKLKKLAQDFR